MVIIDMGTQESSRIRKLCRGQGRLLNKVNGVLTELRAHDKVADNAQVVVVVVREETDIDDYFDDEDDDDDYDDDEDDD